MKRFIAVLIGILGIASAGCSQKAAEGQPTPPPKPAATACKPNGIPRPGTTLTVYVEYDSTNKKGVTENGTIYMCEQDEITWVSPDGDFQDPVFSTVTGSPFDKPFKHVNKKLKSDKPKPGSAGRAYDYTINLVVNGSPYNVDPRIEVMP